MPVLRKRERAQMGLGYSPVAARGDPMADVTRQTAGMLAQKAADYARAMTVEAEDTAKALAKAAVFNTDANGLPTLPDNIAAKMGNAARRTYDAAIETRFIHHMTTSVKMRLSEIANRNINDPEAYIAEAEGWLAEAAANVPAGYEGVFQEIGTGQLVDHAATIGYRQGVMLEEEKRGETGTLIADGLAGIVENVRLGDNAKADAQLAELVETIEATPMSVMNRAQKDAAIEDLFYQVGLSRLITDGDLENAAPEELTAIHAALISGSSPDLAAYFTRPGEDAPDPDQMARAGQHIMQLMGIANERATAERKAATDQIALGEIMGGYRSGTKEEKEILDMGLSGSVKLRGKDGKVRPVQPEDWIYADEQTQANMMQAVKEAGFAPASLEMMFRKAAKSSDPEVLWRTALLYRDLREQPTADGTTVDLTGIVDERLTTLFSLAEDLHGSGEPSQESIETAMQTMVNLEDDRWTPQDFAARMQGDRTFFGQWFREEITAETVDKAISDTVRKGVFEANDLEPRAEEQQEAERVFKLHLETGMAPDAAMEKTRQSFMDRYVESEAAPGRRVWWAPEKIFSTPPARNLTEALGKVQIAAGAEGIALKEWIKEAPNAVIPNFLFTYEVNDGADWARADTWELIANSEISIALQREGIDVDFLRAGEKQAGNKKRFLKAGRDYELRLDSRGPKGRPIYRVFMISTTGARIPLDTRLNMSAEFDKLTVLSEEAKLYEQEKKKRDRAGDAAVEWGLEDDGEFWDRLRKKK
jgi:hypothetical protein